MLRALLSACAVLLAPICLAQTEIEATDIANHPFSVDLASGAKLRLHVRSGEVHVIGDDRNRISVELSGRKAYDAKDLRVRLKGRDGATDLSISGGPRKDVTITVRVPRNTDLYTRVPFGEVHVENIVGNKDIELHAGELTVSMGNAADYSHVDASVFCVKWMPNPSASRTAVCFGFFAEKGAGDTVSMLTSAPANSPYGKEVLRAESTRCRESRSRSAT